MENLRSAFSLHVVTVLSTIPSRCQELGQQMLKLITAAFYVDSYVTAYGNLREWMNQESTLSLSGMQRDLLEYRDRFDSIIAILDDIISLTNQMIPSSNWCYGLIFFKIRLVYVAVFVPSQYTILAASLEIVAITTKYFWSKNIQNVIFDPLCGIVTKFSTVARVTSTTVYLSRESAIIGFHICATIEGVKDMSSYIVSIPSDLASRFSDWAWKSGQWAWDHKAILSGVVAGAGAIYYGIQYFVGSDGKKK